MLNCEEPSRKNRYHDNQLVDLKDYPNGVLPMQNVDANGRLDDYKEMVDLPSMSEVRSLRSSVFVVLNSAALRSTFQAHSFHLHNS